MRFGVIVAIMIDGFAVVWNYVTQPIAPRLGALEMIAHVGRVGRLRRDRRTYLREKGGDPVVTTADKPKGGLEDVVATSSAICYLDGDRGVLAYCGYDIHDLAQSRDVRGGLLPAVAPARCRRARSLATCSRSSRPRAPLPEPIIRLMRIAAAGRRHGRAADAHVRARRTTTRRPTMPRRRRSIARPSG